MTREDGSIGQPLVWEIRIVTPSDDYNDVIVENVLMDMLGTIYKALKAEGVFSRVLLTESFSGVMGEYSPEHEWSLE